MSTGAFLELTFLILFGRLPDEAAIQTMGRMEKHHHILLGAMSSPEFSAPPIMNMRRVRKLGADELERISECFPAVSPADFEDDTKEEFIQRFLNQWLAGELRKDGLTYVQVKSLPRSGHHFLVLLLNDYFQDAAHYCERYAPPGCCHNIPCVKPFNEQFTNKYMIQKSHDFKLMDVKSEVYKYIIQHRSIVTRAQSNFELAIKNPHSGFTDTLDDFQRFCLEEVKHTIEFYNKWLADDGLEKCVISYEDLIQDTGQMLEKAIRYIVGDASGPAKTDRSLIHAARRYFDHRRRMAHALKLKRIKVNTFNSPAGWREPTRHRYFDKGFCVELEQFVHAGCPDVNVKYYFL